MWTQEARQCQEGLSFDQLTGWAAGGLAAQEVREATVPSTVMDLPKKFV